MKRLRAIVSRLMGLFRRGALETEMSEELRAHLDGLIERNRAAGLSPEEARHAALRTFGGIEQVKESCRDQRTFIWFEQVRQDFSHALRALARHRGFTLVAVVTLALGIGVNATLFSVFNAVALRPLPLKDPEQLVDIHGINDIGWRSSSFSYADYLDLRAAQGSLEDLAAWMEHSMRLSSADRKAASFFLRSQSGDTTQHVPVQLVTENYFALLGAEIVLGRGFSPEENVRPGAHPVIVLQHRFWVEQFETDGDVLGKTLTLGDIAFTIIGIAAPEFMGRTPAPPIGWIPAMMLEAKDGNAEKALADRNNARFSVLGRLKPTTTREAVRAELEVIVQRLAQEYPGNDRAKRVELRESTSFMPIALDWKMATATSPMWLSFFFVLIVACANVANLLLARACTRQQEIGVRLALGATRGRIIRHLLTESILIATAGGAAGLFVTTWILHTIRPHIIALLPPSRVAREWLFLNLNPDYRVFAFTLVLALLAAMAAGLFPALMASRANVNGSLKNDGSVFTRPSRMRHGLVVAQVALCFTLLAASGLLVRHVLHVAAIQTGLRTENVFTGQISVLGANFRQLDPAAQRQAVEESMSPLSRFRALELARTLPGIKAIAQVNRAPFTGRMRLAPAIPDGGGDDAMQPVKFNLVSPEYFTVLGIALKRGRLFSVHDAASGARVVVISEATARRFWPGEDAIGKRIKIGAIAFEGGWSSPRQAQRDPPGAYAGYEVIGVVPDVRSGWILEPDETMFYLPLPPGSPQARAVLVQLTGPRETTLPQIWSAVQTRGLGLGMSLRQSLDEWRDLQLLPYKAAAGVSACLGGLALLLSIVGLYGVMAFAVNQRTREIGIRVALGATAQRIVRLFVRQGMRLVGIGLLVGSVGALLATLALAKLVAGARAFDPLPLAVVAVLLGVAALIACWLPARRTTKVDPVVALRAE